MEYSAREGQDVSGAMLERCAEGYVEAWRRFARMTRGSIEEADGVTRIATGIRNTHFNPVFVTRLPRDPEAVIAAARSFFAREGLTWKLVLIGRGGEEAAPLGRAAEAIGLERVAANPGMMLAPIPASSAEEEPRGAELSVEVIDNPASLRVYTDLMADGFEMSLDALEPLNTPETLGTLDVTRYLGRVDGQPVATGLRATVNRVAVIFNVLTMPAWRRRGFGEAITWRAVRDGLDEGCVASFLQSSIPGYSVYLRMGYRHVTDFHVWEPKT